jgi:hypothetical protein
MKRILCVNHLVLWCPLVAALTWMSPTVAAEPQGMPRRYPSPAMPILSPNPYHNMGWGAMYNSYPLSRQAPAYRAYSSGASAPQGNRLESQGDAYESEVSRILTAAGVPNEEDKIRWPVGLCILERSETGTLRQQIDALFHEAATAAAAGSADPQVLKELTGRVKAFRRRLLRDEEERFGMPLAVYEEADRFLTRLARAAKALEATPKTGR